MFTLAQVEFQQAEIGSPCELPHVGSALENPHVYDASARELKAMAERRLLEVTHEIVEGEGQAAIIKHLELRRLR